MKTLLLLFTLLALFVSSNGQTASQVLENGKKIGKKERLFLKYEDSVLKYHIGEDLSNPYFRTLKDSSIFMSYDELHVYLLPYNPLKYSHKYNNVIITDPIDSIARAALIAMIDGINGVINKKSDSSNNLLSNYDTEKNVANENFVNLKDIFNSINSDELIKAIPIIYNDLYTLNFCEKDTTVQQFNRISIKYNSLLLKYSEIDSMIKKADTIINEGLKNGTNEEFTIWYSQLLILRDLQKIHNEKKKSFIALQNAYKLVKEAIDTAIVGYNGMTWIIRLDNIEMVAGKMTISTQKIYSGSFSLSKQNELTTIESKLLYSKVIKYRKMRTIIPEVNTGLAYTMLKYYTYGTTSDSSGQQFVASPTENTLKQFNPSVLINWNLFIQDVEIIPFGQTGFGFNSVVPVFMLGAGIRNGYDNKNRFAVSGGLAVSWIQQLSDLKVGVKVSGTDDINKDLQYEFSWPPKPYLCVQFRF